MSDEKMIEDEELDKITGGVGTHPLQPDPIRPATPPTHPGRGVSAPIQRPSSPVG